MLSDERLLTLWQSVSWYGPRTGALALMRAIEREARREALEEAAKACDAKANELDPGDLGLANQRKAGIACGMCAAAIRALIHGNDSSDSKL